jgi:hypothetical protein
VSQAVLIRNGLVTSLQSLLLTNGGLLAQVNPYPTANPEPPCLYVADGEVDYDQTMGRGDDLRRFMLVTLFPLGGPDVSTQTALDAMRDGTGALSVKTLVETDRSLGGVCQALRVTNLSRSQLYETPAQPARIGCEWTVEVYT